MDVKQYREIIERLDGFFSDGTDLVRAPLPESILSEVEELIGFPLPLNYREFLAHFGGLSLPNALIVDRESSEELGGIELFYAVSLDDPSQGLVNEYRQWSNSFVRYSIELFPVIKLICDTGENVREISWPPEFLPIGMDAGNNQICIALGEIKNGSIFLWKNAPAHKQEDIQIFFDNFDQFILSLRNK